jgi:hypothetical protein
VVLLSDGYATEGELRHPAIVAAVGDSGLVANRARLFAVGVGDDANRTLLTELANLADGNYAWCADTADTGRLAETVAARMAAAVMNDVELVFGDPDNIVDGYPLSIPTFSRAARRWWSVVTTGARGHGDATLPAGRGGAVEKTFTVTLPDKANRAWESVADGPRRGGLSARAHRREGEKRNGWMKLSRCPNALRSSHALHEFSGGAPGPVAAPGIRPVIRSSG